jgi:IS605 OrfB family transposase
MITLKIPYRVIENDFLKHFQREYNNAVRLSYNRWVDKDIVGYSKGKVSYKNKETNNYKNDIRYWLKDNIKFNYIDLYMITCAITNAKGIYDSIVALNKYYKNQNKSIILYNQRTELSNKTTTYQKPLKKLHKLNDPKKHIFGGRKNLQDRTNDKITRKEFQLNRLLPVNIIGSGDKKEGNRKFEFNAKDILTVKFSRKYNYDIQLLPTNKKHRNLLEELYNIKNIPITYSINNQCVYIIFDETKLPSMKKHNTVHNSDIALGIDVNPGMIGISIIHNTKLLYSEQLITNNPTANQKCSLAHMAKQVNRLIHKYNVGLVVMEKLNFLPGKNSFNKEMNKKLSGWNRGLFRQLIQKYCNIYGIKLKEVNPAYSSVIGNALYPNIPDACAAAIEIARRGIWGDNKTNYPAFKTYGPDFHWKDLKGLVINGWAGLSQELYKLYRDKKIRWRNPLPAGYPEKHYLGLDIQYNYHYTASKVLI